MTCPVNDNLLLIVDRALPVLGTLGGALIGWIVARSQYKMSIHKVMVLRKIETYETLLELVSSAQGARPMFTAETHTPLGVGSAFLNRLEAFHEWYQKFQTTWVSRQYILDDASTTNCRAIQDFVAKMLDDYPQLQASSSSWSGIATQDIVSLHRRFLELLQPTYQSLRQQLERTLVKGKVV